jgi:hypothetical protein
MVNASLYLLHQMRIFGCCGVLFIWYDMVLAARKIRNINYRVAVIFVFFVALFLNWAELAVGVFESPFTGS